MCISRGNTFPPLGDSTIARVIQKGFSLDDERLQHGGNRYFRVILGVLGIVGSIVLGLPGPPLGWAGILLMYFFGRTDKAGDPMSQKLLFILFGTGLKLIASAVMFFYIIVFI